MAKLKWERVKQEYSDGTYEVRGYKMNEYYIEPQYIISIQRPIGYRITKEGKYFRSFDTLREAKAHVERM